MIIEYSRNPTPKEIKFGNGDRIYTRVKESTAWDKNKERFKRRIKLDGKIWTYCGPVRG